jgi:hypothetical protein
MESMLVIGSADGLVTVMVSVKVVMNGQERRRDYRRGMIPAPRVALMGLGF